MNHKSIKITTLFLDMLKQFNCAAGRSDSPPPVRRKPVKKKPESTTETVTNQQQDPNNNVQLDRVSSNEQETFSFYEMGAYKAALKRCDNGGKLAKELEEMISERAKIEDLYVNGIKNWHKKWSNHLNEDSAEHPSTKEAWQAYLDLSGNVARVHSDMCQSLIKGPIAKVKEWIKLKYGKSFVNYKQTKEFETDFESAEKPYVEQIEKLKKFKKEYHDDVKACRVSEEAARASHTNPKISQEQREKLDEKAKRAREEMDRSRTRYKEKITEIGLYKNQHMKVMKEVFERTQNFENERILFFKQLFLECHELMQIQDDERYDAYFKEFMEQVNQMNPKEDLRLSYKQLGLDVEPNWPQYEEYQN